MLPKKELSLFDSTCLIVGIIIGAGIYQMAPDIAKGAGSISGIFLIWIVGGLLSLYWLTTTKNSSLENPPSND